MLKSPWWKGSQESVASSTRFRFGECSSDRIIPSFILNRLFSRCRNLAWTRPPKRHYARITLGDSWEQPPPPAFLVPTSNETEDGATACPHFPVPSSFLPEGPPGILLSPLHHPRRDNPRRSRFAPTSIGAPGTNTGAP